MNVKTTTTMIIALVAMISMTGLAMAGSTTDVYIGDGHYYTDYSGSGTGDLTILTFTSDGADMLYSEWDGTVDGWQEMDAYGWTEIERGIYTVGDGVILANSVDNSGDSITAFATAEGIAGLYQSVEMGSYSGCCYDEDYVYAFTMVGGIGEYAAGVMTEAGNANTAVIINGTGMGGVISDAYACTWYCCGGSDTNQEFLTGGLGEGTGYIGTTGEYVDWSIDFENDGFSDYTGGYLYGDPANKYVINDFSDYYYATGYIYAYEYQAP